MRFEDISISKIQLDHRLFEVSFLPDLTVLKNSIEKKGILQPVHLKAAGEGRFQIVCGFRRIECAQALGFTQAPAFILEDHVSLLECFERAVEENFFSRKFNLVEKAVIIQKLEKEFQISKEILIQRYLPFLGLSSSEAVYQLYKNILALDPVLQDYSVRNGLPTHAIEEFFKFHAQDQKTVIPFLHSVHFSVSTLKEFLIWIYEISLRDRASVSELLVDPLNHVVRNPAIDGRQKLQNLRQWLKNKRYPMLSSLETRFVLLKQKLHLPLESSEFFEDNKIHMKLSFQNKEELEQWIEKMKEASLRPELDELLKMA
ncbi:MAG: ParB N-terminal domain-containing protein [Deltaproteobacteria bacterium]|nr:ParB N-terminal domain-containing protein [Deltaproteobacteria bacterium]